MRRKIIGCRELHKEIKKWNLTLEAETENPQPDNEEPQQPSMTDISAAQTVPEDTTSSKSRELPAPNLLRCSLATSWSIAAMASSTEALWPTGTRNSDR